TVLATDLEKHAALSTKSLHTLETSDCHTHIFWTLQCWSKGTGLIDYAANCSTTCADLLQGGKPKGEVEEDCSIYMTTNPNH
ncbi:hypothetical protein XENORESO_013608, partial [Xenotaenia resolanae]